MNAKNIITTLSHLQRLRIGGEPDPTWVASARAQLMERVSAERAPRRVTVAEAMALLRTAFRFDATLMARPVLASILAVAAIMGSGVGAVSASLGSIPGDALYQVKIASERASIAVASSNKDKATLRVAYVGRRVEEVGKIARQEPDKTVRLNAAVQHLEQDLGSVKQALADVSATAAPQAAAAVAKLVDEKSTEYTAALKETNEQLPVPAQAAVKEVQALVEDISVQAVAVLVQAHADGGATTDEVTASVGQKIDTITTKANQVATVAATSTPALPSTETANQAIVALDEAKNLLERQDFVSALGKVIEGQALVQAAEKIIDATSGATALSTLSAASSTLAIPLIGNVSVSSTPTTTSTPACGTTGCQQPRATSTASEPVPGVSTSTSPSSGG